MFDDRTLIRDCGSNRPAIISTGQLYLRKTT